MGKFLILTTFFLLLTTNSFAQVRLNEFQIEPEQSVEILNTATTSADTSGWYIDDNGGTTFYTIPQNSILLPNSCLVFTSNFNLNKSSADTVRLFDKSNPPTSSQSVLVDSFSYQQSPGNNISFSKIVLPRVHNE